MNYSGVVIEESLADKKILDKLLVTKTKIETVTEKHRTPWLKQWTLHDVEIPEEKAEEIARNLSTALEKGHPWYTDFKNDKFHFIIYREKIFKVDLKNPILFKDAKAYGISLGIPPYQVDFVPEDGAWER